MACVKLAGSPEERIEQLARLTSRWARDPVVLHTIDLRTIHRSLVELLRLVQSLPYQSDTAGSDLVCDPADVFARGGDCEDRAALLAALLYASGYAVQLVWQADEAAPEDHVTVKVRLRDGSWAWADPTVPGAQIGEEPHAAAARTGYRARVGMRSAGAVRGDGSYAR